MGRGVAVAVAIVGLGGCSETAAPSFGVATDSTGTSEPASTTSAAGTSAATSSGDYDGCRVDEDCGELRCVGGVCYGCDTRADCAEDQRCWFDECRELDEVPHCVQLEVTTCGDGILGAPEECDGPGCVECIDGVEPQEWIVSERIDRVISLPDGDALAIQSYGSMPSLVRHGPRSVEWAVALENDASDVAVDASGNAYAAGSQRVGDTLGTTPWLASWDAAGELRWELEEAALGGYTSIGVEGTRVLVAGWTEQIDSPWPRALLAQYDSDGALAWSQKHAEFSSFLSMVVIGSETAVIGASIYPWYARTLERIDDDGVTLWSMDVSPVSGTDDGPHSVIHDGGGGSWVYGERDGGPWAVHHDASGEEIERLECVGRTEGSVWNLAADARGRLAVAVLVRGHTEAVEKSTPWIAFVDGGEITSASLLGPIDASLRTFDLAWRADGSLTVGLRDNDLDVDRVLLVHPGAE